MTKKDELAQARFLLNMGRINGLVRLLNSTEALMPTGLLQSEGARADILRSIVVFLHATFEDFVRSHIRSPKKQSWCFCSGTDLDKALKLSGIDAKPFKSLHPTLTQMAKRRNQIVHHADLSKPTDTASQMWGITDEWVLMMWLMAVPAFYYRLRMSVNDGDGVEGEKYEGLRKAMLSHIDFGNQLVAFAKVPPELQRKGLERILDTLNNITSTLSASTMPPSPK